MAIDTPSLFFALWVAVLALALWGMLTSSKRIPAWVHQNDKIMHFLVFGLLAGLAHGAWPSVPLLTLWTIHGVLGVLSEVAQHHSAHHRFCWQDALANAAGAGCVLSSLHWAL
jgi:hypothetical protein